MEKARARDRRYLGCLTLLARPKDTGPEELGWSARRETQPARWGGTAHADSSGEPLRRGTWPRYLVSSRDSTRTTHGRRRDLDPGIIKGGHLKQGSSPEPPRSPGMGSVSPGPHEQQGSHSEGTLPRGRV